MSLFPASEHTSRLIPGILLPIPLTIHTCLTMVGLGIAGSWALSKWMKDKGHRRRPSRASVAVAVSNLEEEIREKETELERLRKSLKAREENALRRDEELKAVKAELDRRKETMQSTESQAQLLQADNASLSARIQALTRENQQFRSENAELTSRLGHTTQLLDTRTAELSDVMKMVEALNGEILQTAAFMAESFVFDSKRHSASTPTPGSVAGIQPPAARHVNSEDHKEAWGGATDILGHKMIAFQAAMSAYAHWVITSWYFEDPEDEHLLNEIYARVRESGSYIAHPSCRNAFKQSSGRNYHELRLEAFYVAPEVNFNVQTMEDAYATDDKTVSADSERVLCTTDLGLVRAERKPGKDAEWMESVLLKPKVVLLSGIQDMIQMPNEDEES
ncbi:hypothetical protein BDQ17DRAFT_1414235 [Cyathus striatus]|nr:hypothetical protein BDQ17DRAFT_1414235 [Cyathus striatus]